jgi:aspartate aminotransferase
MTRVSARLGAISESATMAISNRASEMRRQGRDVISFGAGEPDYETPAHIVDAAVAAARDPRNHKYSANRGLPELRRGDRRADSADDD